ncbi:hypothetical protein D3C71_2074230 [compost metagenome]
MESFGQQHSYLYAASVDHLPQSVKPRLIHNGRLIDHDRLAILLAQLDNIDLLAVNSRTSDNSDIVSQQTEPVICQRNAVFSGNLFG